jgi:hypothetical protein
VLLFRRDGVYFLEVSDEQGVNSESSEHGARSREPTQRTRSATVIGHRSTVAVEKDVKREA